MDRKVYVANYERPYFYTRTPLPPPPPQPPVTGSQQPHGFNLKYYKVSPSVLLIIILVAMVFFIFGLLHLLVRYLMRPTNREYPDEYDNLTALQGQLQQLFHLHDSGVDQSFFDRLPVFTYKSISGVKDPFDCAVCLSEFRGEDKLRLLSNCSHAFHMDCIDTWLLSHSTCPLCRDSLLSSFTPRTSCSPIVLVLESETSREICNFDHHLPNSSSIQRVSSHLSNEDFEFEKGVKEDDGMEKVVTIKLGKFKNVDGCGEGIRSEKQTIDSRRCYSMGYFEYVVNDDSSLQVPIKKQVKKQASKKSSLPITPSHRPAMSECDGDSRRDFNGFEVLGGGSGRGVGANEKSKRDGFSVSKIWLTGKKDKGNSSVGAAIGSSSRSWEVGGWEDDQEVQMCQWLDPPPLEESNPPSFARRSLQWLMGWQQIKMVHSSTSTYIL